MSYEVIPLSRRKKLAHAISGLTNLVAYYPLNELSGNAINRAPDTLGTLPGTVAGATQGVAGNVGLAYSFDGTNDSVEIADVNSISDATALTVGLFLKSGNLTQDHYLVGQGTGGSGFLLIADDVGSSSGRTNTFKVFIEDDGGVDIVFLEAATDSNAVAWKFVAFTFQATSATGLRFYVNGVEDANSPADATAVDNAGKQNTVIRIGERSDGQTDAIALMQDVFFVSRVMTAAELLRIAKVAGLA